jgi:hypothetical protein
MADEPKRILIGAIWARNRKTAMAGAEKSLFVASLC